VSAASSSPLLDRLVARPERFPGALLLQGRSEAALEAVSRRLAAALLCPGEDPELRCDSCRRVLSAFHPDQLTLEPEGVQIRIDRVREAVAFGAGMPYESARRVVRIGRADLLGMEAANALLKSLEEPGSRLHWILATTRPESLLPTIRSRCLAATVRSPSSSERAVTWREGGLSEDDAEDLALFAPEMEEGAALRLEEDRRFRSDVVEALRSGLLEGRLAALVLLAEKLARAENRRLHVAGELLGDIALLASGAPGEHIRHRAVAGPLAEIARRTAGVAIREAAVFAADFPADTRRGNRRLHFEKVFLQLALASQSERTCAATPEQG